MKTILAILIIAFLPSCETAKNALSGKEVVVSHGEGGTTLIVKLPASK